MKNAATKLMDKWPKLKVAVNLLGEKDVLVGVPSDTTTRKDSDAGPLNNATLAYIHDNGSPANNIPARPFMSPGMEAAKPRIVAILKATAKKAPKEGAGVVDRGLNAAGLTAQGAIRKAINDGIGPALTEATLRARIRAKTGVKGAKAELAARKAGAGTGTGNAKPLVATGQLRNSINYVLRRRKK